MNLKCHECADIAIKDGKEDAENASEALSLFPVTQVLSTSAGVMVTTTALPLCYLHRKLQVKQSSSGLVTA